MADEGTPVPGSTRSESFITQLAKGSALGIPERRAPSRECERAVQR